MIKKEEVIKIANLARINLKEEEIFIIQKDISSILDYFNLLSDLDVLEIDPFSFSHLSINEYREDSIIIKNENLKSQFPEEENNYLKVKEIF